jgi:hypothetical protein
VVGGVREAISHAEDEAGSSTDEDEVELLDDTSDKTL